MIEIIPIDETSVAQLLEKVSKDKLDYVLIIGQKDDGWYFAASEQDPTRAVFSAHQFCNYMAQV